MILFLAAAALTLWCVGIVVAILGSVDAATQPRELWAATGQRRDVWLWQAVAVIAVPVALVYSGAYFLRVRPKLTKADVTKQADADWARGQRWYQRLNPARRSPTRWAQAARRWWVWLLVVAAAAVACAEQLVLVGRHGSYVPSRGSLEVQIGLWAAVGVTAAVRAGFWYGEHMRLTGRRPASGGPLRPRSPHAGN